MGVARAMARVLSIRPSQIDVDDLHIEGDDLTISKFQMRGRFAMRLADYRDEESTACLGGVRDAFNSPFRSPSFSPPPPSDRRLDFRHFYRQKIVLLISFTFVRDFRSMGPSEPIIMGTARSYLMGRRRQPIWCLQDQDRSAMRGHGNARGLKQRSGAQALSRGNNRERPKPSASLPPTPIGFA